MTMIRRCCKFCAGKGRSVRSVHSNILPPCVYMKVFAASSAVIFECCFVRLFLYFILRSFVVPFVSSIFKASPCEMTEVLFGTNYHLLKLYMLLNCYFCAMKNALDSIVALNKWILFIQCVKIKKLQIVDIYYFQFTFQL